MKFFWGKVLVALCLTSLGVLNANAQRGKGWYVQFGGGIDVVTNGDNETMGALEVSGGYYINKLIGLGVDLNIAPATGTRSTLGNFSSKIRFRPMAYKSSRIFEVEPFAGLGYGWSKYSPYSNSAVTGKLGCDLLFNCNPKHTVQIGVTPEFVDYLWTEFGFNDLQVFNLMAKVKVNF